MCRYFHISKARCNLPVSKTLGALGNSSDCRPEESPAKGTAVIQKARNRVFIEVSGFNDYRGIVVAIAFVEAEY